MRSFSRLLLTILRWILGVLFTLSVLLLPTAFRFFQRLMQTNFKKDFSFVQKMIFVGGLFLSMVIFALPSAKSRVDSKIQVVASPAVLSESTTAPSDFPLPTEVPSPTFSPTPEITVSPETTLEATPETTPLVISTPFPTPLPTLKPTPKPTPRPTPRPTAVPVPVEKAPVMQLAPPSEAGGFTCNCAKTCPNMSCSEAQFQLKSCGCGARDADKDGVACDAQCQ